MTEKQRKHILDVLPLFLVGLAVAVFIMLSIVDAGSESIHLHRLHEGQTSSAEVSAYEPVVMSVELGSDFSSAQTLCFYTMYADVYAFLDGEEIYRLEKAGRGVSKASPNYWNTISLPQDSAGKILELRFVSPYANYAGKIPDVYFGDFSAVTRHVMLQTVPRFVASMAILIIGAIFGIVSVILRFYTGQNTGLYSFSMFVIVLGMFLAAQYKTLLIWMYDGMSYIFLQQTCFALLPALYARYMVRSSRGLQKRIAIPLHTISLLNFAAVMLLQCFGVLDLVESSVSTKVLCMVMVVYVCLMEIRRQRRINIFLAVILASYAFVRYFQTGTITWLVYIGVFVYLYQMAFGVISNIVRAEARQIRLEAELEVSKSEIATIQITSHFFYHTLDSIRALIRLDADKAYKMTGDFSKYLRHRVDGVEGMQGTIPFSRELRSIRAYTNIKKAQLGDRFTMEFDIETEDFDILPLTVQPLVENAVIHAMQHRREGGIVRLVCRELKTGYRIEVIDNGPGAQAQFEKRDEEKRSTAVANVNKRLEFYGIAPLVYESNEQGGVTVRLFTPKSIERKGKVECA